jgi:hypothetical protein
MVLIAIVVLTLLGGIWYITNLKADLAVSEMNAKTLKDAAEQQNQLIEKMQADIAQIQTINKDLLDQNEKQKKDVETLSRKFDKRDFGVFVANQTEKAEQLINRGTKNAMRCLELASGAPLTEEEKKAKSPTEANRECPNLINNNYSAPAN